jgi:hypothetical protein
MLKGGLIFIHGFLPDEEMEVLLFPDQEIRSFDLHGKSIQHRPQIGYFLLQSRRAALNEG